MKSILVAVDFSDVSDRVVLKAGELAAALGAKVWVMHAVTDTSYINGGMGEVPVPWTLPDEDLPRHFPSEMGRLRDYTSMLLDKSVDAESVLVSGPAIERIMHVADLRDADLIVMGSHGHGALYELIVGTVSEGLMRRSQTPVMIVPSVAKKERERVEAYTREREVPIATPY